MKIPEELLPVVEWWETNGKKAIVVGVVALIAGIAYLAWTTHQERARTAAAEATSSALAAWAQCMDDPTSEEATAAIQGLRDSVATFTGKGASVVKLTLANALFRRGTAEDYADALAIYDELLATGENLGAYGDIPALGRAHCLEATGKFAEAQAAFDAFVEANPAAYQTLTAQLGAARCLAQADKKDEAVARLEKLMKEKNVSAVLERALPLEQQLGMYRQFASYFAQQGKLTEASRYQNEVEKLEKSLGADADALPEAKAIKYTLDLVKRWTADRPEPLPPAPAPAPAAEAPAAAAPAPAAPAAEPAAPAPAAAPAPTPAPAAAPEAPAKK